MSHRFKDAYGSYAIVTGASEGIGRAVAIELAGQGLSLVLVARRKEKLEELRGLILKSCEVEVEILPLDLSKPDSGQTLFRFVERLDIGLYAGIAGFGTSGNFVDGSIGHELEMIDLNCRAVVEQTFYFANLFKQKRRGGVILMSSLVAFQGVPRAACYSATKAFIQSFAEGIHRELKPYGVDVLAVAPGPVHSGFAGRAGMTMAQAGAPEEIAGKILKAMGRKVTVRPGFLSKFLGWSLLTLGRWHRVLAMEKIMGRMTTGSSVL
ncbi:MAG: SDR family NAD(P)-dependent oxidoreductase [Bdellovibrionales bacterium]|nr:SDR family NAD(P)-dependent oxidoreductase [Bdellovibrionales bacterium]